MADVLTPDLCIIGAGAGGLELAERARAFGAEVVLIERGRMGGERLNTGGVPAQALIGSARHAHALRSASRFGMANDEPKINFRRINEHIQEVVAAPTPQASTERFEALGVTVIKADAQFIDKRTLKAGEATIRARRFVIATGSTSFVPPIPGLSEAPFFTTETLFENTRKLSHLVIIGGGAVGIELAQAYRRLGSDVTVVEAGSVLSKSDPELVDIALRRMREEGVVIYDHTEVTAIQTRALGIGVVIRSGDRDVTLDASHILVAAGRLPYLDGLDLEKAGVKFAKVDARQLQLKRNLKTTNGRIYAIGDAAGGLQYSHVATHQAGLVLANALFGQAIASDPDRMAYVTYCDPEIAEVGMTEPRAREKLRGRFKIIRASFGENDRARVDGDTEGLIKLVTDTSGKILGAGIVGKQAGELISLFAMAVANGLSVKHFMSYVAPYPTLGGMVQKLGEEFYRDKGRDAWQMRLMALNRLLP
jgi:pyruvate/2-oxoglutarate dehydrogenase complex dihydrolipoamide dehydrogenase (E3) component